jgi:hypothetical protein
MKLLVKVMIKFHANNLFPDFVKVFKLSTITFDDYLK